MHPRAFGIGSKTVNSNNASLDGLVSVYYLEKVFRSKYTLHCMIILPPAWGYAFVSIRIALGFV